MGCYENVFTAEALRALLEREPFVPFSVWWAGSEEWPVGARGMAAVSSDGKCVAVPRASDGWLIVTTPGNLTTAPRCERVE